jgi:YfiH family protein
MIIPPERADVVFSEAGDGDLRHDPTARETLSRLLAVDDRWATLRQVHGAMVLEATSPGETGEGDALWTDVPGLPLAVFTADCYPVVVHSSAAVGVAHTGWRGAHAGVVSRLLETMSAAGHEPESAVIGPGIGACCFEVGPEVLALFPDAVGSTSWGTSSIDLPEVIARQLSGLRVERTGGCTRHEERFFSHRRDQTRSRQVGLGWLG